MQRAAIEREESEAGELLPVNHTLMRSKCCSSNRYLSGSGSLCRASVGFWSMSGIHRVSENDLAKCVDGMTQRQGAGSLSNL